MVPFSLKLAWHSLKGLAVYGSPCLVIPITGKLVMSIFSLDTLAKAGMEAINAFGAIENFKGDSTAGISGTSSLIDWNLDCVN